MKMVKDVKVVSGEERTPQHKLICDLIIKSGKEAKKTFIPRHKIWKLRQLLKGNSESGCKEERGQEIWWWNEIVENATQEKRRLWKEWKACGSKESYLDGKDQKFILLTRGREIPEYFENT